MRGVGKEGLQAGGKSGYRLQVRDGLGRSARDG